ncbi:porin family protein [uncultured Aquimarina sp.]|uniref:porin family protein n=1 Tax=uncultured Aquimarina sp. TaxID=575652 RepID=UPI00260CF986|nr:porin family protein [uncultured Aquimarina sp.]
MVKKLLLVLFLGVVTVTNAQEESIRFGAKAGLNLANITGDQTDELSTRTSFHIGALVEIPLSDKFALQPELMYSAQGAKFEFSEFGFTDESTVKLDYLNIPVMAKFYVVEGLSIQAGPQLGILLSAKDEGEDSIDGEYEEDIKDFVSSIDLGLNFGLGYQLEAGIFFEGRYNLGLTNIDDDDEAVNDSSIRNSVIQFSVGYKF